MRFDYDTETLYLESDKEESINIECYDDHIILMINLYSYKYNLFGTNKNINTINNLITNKSNNLNHSFVMRLFKTLHGDLKQRICFINLDGIDYQLILEERPYLFTGSSFGIGKFRVIVLRIL